MYTQVIVGVDGGPGGQNAAALAAALAERDATFTLVYVSVPFVDRESGVDLELAEDDSLWSLLADEVALCGDHAQIARVTAGSVGAGLERSAADHGADLIVVGASSKHGLAKLTGDDVRSVMHRTPCTVAVAPASYAHTPNVFARIGVAFDGSDESEVALAHAGLIAADRNAEVIVRHVVKPRVYGVGLNVMTTPLVSPEIALAAARDKLSEADGLPVEHVHGPLCDELVSFSKHVQLLVCGSRHNGLAKRIVAGSTSDYLARHAAAPLIVAPSADTPSIARWRELRRTAA